MVFFFSFLVGIFLGSFLNVLIDRLSTGRGFVSGRSYCEVCKKTLKSFDLIPLFSYLFLKGKCRHCKAKIPFRLFLVEMLTGITATVCIYLFVTGSLPLYSSILIFLILFSFLGIFVADVVYGIIPDLFVVLSLVASLFYVLVEGLPLYSHIAAAFGSLFFFFFLFVITKGKGMGLGDVKLSFVLGLVLGFPQIIVALYLAFLTGAAISIILVVWRKLRFFGSTIPFGPFLVASSVVALFYGEVILSAFVQNFL